MSGQHHDEAHKEPHHDKAHTLHVTPPCNGFIKSNRAVQRSKLKRPSINRDPRQQLHLQRARLAVNRDDRTRQPAKLLGHDLWL